MKNILSRSIISIRPMRNNGSPKMSDHGVIKAVNKVMIMIVSEPVFREKEKKKTAHKVKI